MNIQHAHTEKGQAIHTCTHMHTYCIQYSILYLLVSEDASARGVEGIDERRHVLLWRVVVVVVVWCVWCKKCIL